MSLIWVIEIVYDMNGTETINVSALFPSCFDHLHLAKTLNKLKYNPDLEKKNLQYSMAVVLFLT